MSRKETSLGGSFSAGIWFTVATSTMFARDQHFDDWPWWGNTLTLILGMFLYTVSFYALTKAISMRIAEDIEAGLRKRSSPWKKDD